jgi:hypothetical protein
MKSKELAVAISLTLCVSFLRADGIAREPPPIRWGPVTNGLRAGLCIQQSLKSGSDATCQTIIYVGTTNLSTEVRAYCPKTEELFLAELIDSRGRQVPKTRLGARFGRVPSPEAQLKDRPRGGPKGWQICIVTADHENQVGHFNAKDHFLIAEPGTYRLRVQVRLYRQGGSGQLELFMLPAVTVPVTVP